MSLRGCFNFSVVTYPWKHTVIFVFEWVKYLLDVNSKCKRRRMKIKFGIKSNENRMKPNTPTS
jgi:hypothetical protein